MKAKKVLVNLFALVGACALLAGCGKESISNKETVPQSQVESTTEATQGNISETTEETKEDDKIVISPDTPGLCELYKDNYPIGVALPGNAFKKGDIYIDNILKNYNSITCENEMKPDSILDQNTTRKDVEGNYLHAAVNFSNCQAAIDFALEHNMKMRLHVLVWHSQTPAWFFTEDYTGSGKLVSRDVMLARMENYIKDVLTYFQENYPGLIYAVDVCNEAFDVGDGDENGVRKKNNKWYDTVGDDYYYQAFVFARKYAADDMKLFYNDYACMYKPQLILDHLQKAKDEGLIDGIGMQGHLSLTDDISNKFKITVKSFCQAGYEVQVTELDIGISDDTESSLLKQARKYKAMFKLMKSMQEEGYNISGITVWGLNDAMSWRTGEHALMFDANMNPKPAYLGALLDSSILNME